MERLFRCLVPLSVVLYLTCLICDAFTVQTPFQAAIALFFGMFGLFFYQQTPSNLVWLANPIIMFAYALAAAQLRIASAIVGVSALSLALSFRLAEKVTVGAFREGTPVALAMPIAEYRIGYWLWVASMVIFCASALAQLRRMGSA